MTLREINLFTAQYLCYFITILSHCKNELHLIGKDIYNKKMRTACRMTGLRPGRDAAAAVMRRGQQEPDRIKIDGPASAVKRRHPHKGAEKGGL